VLILPGQYRTIWDRNKRN